MNMERVEEIDDFTHLVEKPEEEAGIIRGRMREESHRVVVVLGVGVVWGVEVSVQAKRDENANGKEMEQKCQQGKREQGRG
jgi:hypothetical protein